MPDEVRPIADRGFACAYAQGGNHMLRRTAALLAAFGLVLTFAGTALATGLQQETPISWDALEHQGTLEECEADELEYGLQPGDVLWHFILIDGESAGGTLTAEFDIAGTKTDEGSTTGNATHFVVITGEDSLESASTDVDGDRLVLSHICSVPDEEIPEAPVAFLLPIVALAALGGYLFINRRRVLDAV